VLLDFFHVPSADDRITRLAGQASQSMSLDQIVRTVFPELRGKEEFYRQVWSELRQRGLVNTDNLQAMMTPAGGLNRRTTDLGAAFLAFIAEP